MVALYSVEMNEVVWSSKSNTVAMLKHVCSKDLSIHILMSKHSEIANELALNQVFKLTFLLLIISALLEWKGNSKFFNELS